jgi:hypothetical protein
MKRFGFFFCYIVQNLLYCKFVAIYFIINGVALFFVDNVVLRAVPIAIIVAVVFAVFAKI